MYTTAILDVSVGQFFTFFTFSLMIRVRDKTADLLDDVGAAGEGLAVLDDDEDEVAVVVVVAADDED